MSWRFWRRWRASGLTEEQRAALKSLVADARYELIPLASALEHAATLPPGSQVTVTASPSHGIEATCDLADAVAAQGHDVTPHLPAHRHRDRADLPDPLEPAQAHGLRKGIVQGGASWD